MIAKITPSKLSGAVLAPPSKSMAHRYIICASLAKGFSRIDNIAYSEDICATLDCMQALGAKIERKESSVIIEGFSPFDTLPKERLYVRESGSTLRFMVPLALLSGEKVTFYGKSRLFERPLDVYEKIADEKSFVFEKKQDELSVCGKLEGGKYYISENKSSQFISGLLFALPLLSGDSEIILESIPESRPYIDMTLFAMSEFGVKAYFDGDKRIIVPGNQVYKPREISVEGDCSNAAFFEALNLLCADVKVQGISENTLQGDAVYADYFEKIKAGNSVLDISDCPDLAPILMALLSECGTGKLVGTRRLAFKESNRAQVMKAELSKLGAKISCFENEITVEKSVLHAPEKPIMSNGDHRVVMSMAVLLTKYGGEIYGCEDVNKSMPDFFDRLKELGGKVEIIQ